MIAELIAVSFAGSAAAALGMSARRERRRRRMWKDVAIELGAEPSETRSALTGAVVAFDVEVGVARVHVDSYREEFGGLRSRYTRACAMYPQRAAPKFRVFGHGLLSSLGKKLGAVDIELGHEHFDRRYAVKSDDVDGVRKIWSETARRIVMDKLPSADARSNGSRLQVRIPGWCRDREKLLALIELTGELASADLYGRAALRAIAGGTYFETEGEWIQRTAPKVELHLPQRVLIGPIARNGVLKTVAYVAEAPRDFVAMQAQVQCGRVSPDEALASLPSKIQTQLPHVGDGLLMVGKDLRFIWDGVETDPGNLRRCADMLSGLATGIEEGVYR